MAFKIILSCVAVRRRSPDRAVSVDRQVLFSGRDRQTFGRRLCGVREPKRSGDAAVVCGKPSHNPILLTMPPHPAPTPQTTVALAPASPPVGRGKITGLSAAPRSTGREAGPALFREGRLLSRLNRPGQERSAGGPCGPATPSLGSHIYSGGTIFLPACSWSRWRIPALPMR